MANNGVFSDLFNAIGEPVQNIADLAGNTFNALLSIGQSCVNLCATVLTSTVDTAGKLIQDLSTAVSSCCSCNTTPKA